MSIELWCSTNQVLQLKTTLRCCLQARVLVAGYSIHMLWSCADALTMHLLHMSWCTNFVRGCQHCYTCSRKYALITLFLRSTEVHNCGGTGMQFVCCALCTIPSVLAQATATKPRTVTAEGSFVLGMTVCSGSGLWPEG